METGRKIIHVDMDAFFASIEQRDFPELKGKPVAVGGSKERGVVAAASYEARKFGVHSAMPSVTAARKCPDLIFVKHRFDVYKSVSKQIMDIFKTYTDLVEPLSLDEAFLDVTENKKQIPSATHVAQAIKKDILETTNLTASAGVSFNKFLAKIASDMQKPDGLTVITPSQAMPLIEQLPVEKFFGVGKVTAKKMRKLGLSNGKDLKEASLAFLVKHFGKTGNYYHRIANGEDNRPVNANRIRKSVGAERTFDTDLDQEERIRKELFKISDITFERLQKGKRNGKTVTIKIKYFDFVQQTRSKTVSNSIAEKKELKAIVNQLLDTPHFPDKPIRLLGVSVSNFSETESNQLSLDME